MQTENIHLSPRRITIVTPKDTTEIQLRLVDWRRIYRKVKSISPSMSGRELFAGVFWGVTGSAFLSLVPLYQANPPVEPWVKAVLLVIALAALVVGIVIWRGAKDHAKDVITTRDDLMKDMWELHRTYFPSDDLDKNE